MNERRSPVNRVGIFYHADLLGFVPSGIDTFIRSLIKWAPDDIQYTLIGASSDLKTRPLHQIIDLQTGGQGARFLPVISSDASSRHSRIPLTVQFMLALRRLKKTHLVKQLQVLDFHRVEPVLNFWFDPRPKNVFIHNDMEMTRDRNSDMRWRHAPWLYEQIERRTFSRVRRVFSVRESGVNRYKALYSDISDRFFFIPTFVDVEVFRRQEAGARIESRRLLREKLGISGNAQVLIFVGRLDNQKDPFLLLKAFGLLTVQHQKLHLLLVGDGTLRPQLEAHVQGAGLGGKVTFTGAKAPRDIADMLNGSDLFVLSSAYEGMPIAVLEALATGTPVVSTNVGEVGRVVQTGQTGGICAERSPAAFAAAIQSALSALASMSGAPCEHAVGPYNPQTVLKVVYENHRTQCAETLLPSAIY